MPESPEPSEAPEPTWEEHRTFAEQAAQRDEYEAALRHFLAAGTLLSEQLDPSAEDLKQKLEWLAVIQFNIGQLCYQLAFTQKRPEFYDKALHFLGQAERSASKVESAIVPHVHNARGDAYLQKDDPDHAVGCYEQAIATGKAGTPRERSQWYNNLSLAHAFAGNLREMLASMEQSLKILQSLGEFGTMTLQLGNIAVVVDEHDHPDLALKLYERALQLADLWPDRDEDLVTFFATRVEVLSRL